MALIPDSVLDDIRHANPLPEVLQEHGVKLVRGGREYRGACPFEGDGSSKFSVRADRYFCYGCGEKGDLFSFLQKKQGLSFRDAIQWAADRRGISLDAYEKREEDTPETRRRRAADEALAVLAEWSLDLARDRAAEAVTPDGVDLAPLIATGELGWLPEADRIAKHLGILGVSAEAQADIGLTAALATHQAGWMLWARRRQRLLGARPLGQAGPVLGPRGARSDGWVTSPALSQRVFGRDALPVLVAVDDLLYVALRAQGADTVVRALTPSSLRDLRVLPGLKDQPAVLCLRPTAPARAEAFQTALALLGGMPRLRALEVDPLPVAPAAERQAALSRALERAGTVFDWQVHRLAAADAFATPDGRAKAAGRLGRLVAAVQAPVERLAYLLETTALTGLGPTGGTRPAPTDSAQRTRSGIGV